VRRTSGAEDYEVLDPIPITESKLVATIVPRSVTTFVIDCVSRD
jgi:hypothetical protein